MEHRNADVIIAGTGVAGLFAALHLPKNKRILMQSFVLGYSLWVYSSKF